MNTLYNIPDDIFMEKIFNRLELEEMNIVVRTSKIFCEITSNTYKDKLSDAHIEYMLNSMEFAMEFR